MRRDLGAAARALPPRRAGRDRDRHRRLPLLRGAGPPGAARRRRPAGARLLRLRQGAPGAARRHRPAVRAALRGGRRTPRCGTRTSTAYDVLPRSGRSLSRASVSKGRADLPRPAPAGGQVQARRAVHPRRRPGRPAAPRGGAGLQLLPRADGARPRGDALPRVRPPAAPRARRPRRVDPLLRGRHRVGLRRGAEPDARGVGVGRRRAADLRHATPRGRADPGRPGRADARRRRLRQGLPGADPDVLRRDVVLVPHRRAPTT